MKHKILFLAADSLRSDRTAFDLEAREIQVEIERSAHRDRFELVTRWAAQPLDLLRELRRVEPTIVHVCGHGGSPAHASGGDGPEVASPPRKSSCSHSVLASAPDRSASSGRSLCGSPLSPIAAQPCRNAAATDRPSASPP